MSIYLKKFRFLFTSLLLPYRNFFIYIFNSSRVLYPSIFLNKKYYIDPLIVQKRTSIPMKPKLGSQLFLDGDWDIKAVPIEEVFKYIPKYKTSKEIICQKLAIKETSEYEFVKSKISKDNEYKGFKDPIEYMKSIANLYDSIKIDGYRENNSVCRWIGEVEIAIGRGGEIIKINSGNHRFACAYLLGEKKIPVNLCAVHSNYKKQFMSDGIFKLNRNIEKIING
jgi:hypothetical protein